MRESIHEHELATRPAVEPGLVDWDESPCLLCGGRSWDVLVEGRDHDVAANGLWFAVVKCRDCGLCFTNPRPSVESIGRFYSADYKPYKGRKLREGLRAALKSWYRTRDERRTLGWHGQGRLLDFGCGSGAFLKRMRQQGWKVTGIDVAEDVVKRLCAEEDLQVLHGTLPHADLEPKSFDVVTMWQSLEHVHDPLETLKQCRRLLTRGGKLVLAVPSIDSLNFRWFGPDWYGLDVPRHLTHFAPVTLHSMLKLAGFHVHEIKQVMHSTWMRASARRACANGKRPAWQHALKWKSISRAVTLYAALARQADCLLATAIA